MAARKPSITQLIRALGSSQRYQRKQPSQGSPGWAVFGCKNQCCSMNS
jgi:hypothetical protein